MESSTPESLVGHAATAPRRAPVWHGQAFRRMIYQVAAVVVLLGVCAWLMTITTQHMHERKIHSGFDFLAQPAGFSIGESVVPFDSSDSFGKALAVGLTNTLRVSVLGIMLATILGSIIGVGRLSGNWLIRAACKTYVDIFRNIPLLLQLFVWYFVLTELLPSIDSALLILPHVYLSKNGLQFVIPVWENGHYFTLSGLVAGLIAGWGWRRFIMRRHAGSRALLSLVYLPMLTIMVLFTVFGWLIGGAPHALDIPEKTVVNMVGGGSVTPEYLAVLLGLVAYTAAYIAEVVRGGVQSVSHGQYEACQALGLSRRQGLRLVRLPQALRVIIPPLTNQYLSLVKNSSLAVAVGYPDLVSVANTTLNQTGRAVECITIVMVCYLILSLFTSLVMNVYDHSTQAWSK